MTMKLQIDHETLFTYDQPVREAVGEARLRPRDEARQRCLSFSFSSEPPTPASLITDRFGNTVHCYSVLLPHRRLKIVTTSLVETSADPLLPDPLLGPMQRHDFLRPSAYAQLGAEVRAFAQAAAPDLSDPAVAAAALARAIFQTCAYVPGSTDLSTTADAVLAGRRGVCQDFAHLLIAAARSLGLPARYVSGYLHDPALPPDAVLASHAWAEVHLAGQGWLGLDPTHDCAAGGRYVRLAVGRDYADAAPMRGIFQGEGREHLAVRVWVREVGGVGVGG